MTEEQIWKATNELVDFYKKELEEYRNKYFRLKEQYDLLLFDIQNKNFDDFRYHGYTLKELLDAKLGNIEN